MRPCPNGQGSLALMCPRQTVGHDEKPHAWHGRLGENLLKVLDKVSEEYMAIVSQIPIKPHSPFLCVDKAVISRGAPP